MQRATGRRKLGLLAVGSVLLGWYGCSERPDPLGTDSLPSGQFSLIAGQDFLGEAIVAQEAITAQLMALPDVAGVGVGLTGDGDPAIKVFLKTGDTAGIPASFDGIPIVPEVSGEFFALHILAQQARPQDPPPGKGKNKSPPVDHTARFDRPVPAGSSTGHPAITACTVSTRLTDGTDVWVMSNNHCYAATNFNAADCSPNPPLWGCALGDPVIQPGTFDGGTTPADDIGTVAAFVFIDFVGGGNEVDGAIAFTSTALVSNQTTADCYGTPQSTTLAPSVNLTVQKCGRTTEQSEGTITAINATVNVNYGAPGVAQFVNQIVTTNMSAGGDSGSLLVAKTKGKNKADNLKPVGLLYAGSAFQTIHNPIGSVLTQLGNEIGKTLTVDGS